MRFVVQVGLAVSAGLLVAGCIVGQQVRGAEALVSARIAPTLYFPSAEVERSSREDLRGQVEALVKSLSGVAPKELVRTLDRAETLMGALQTHDAFLRVRTLEDTTDQQAKSARQQVETAKTVLEAAMDARLRRVPAGSMAVLGRYAFLAQTAQREAAHELSPEAERYRGAVVEPAEQSLGDAYDRVDAGLGGAKGVSSQDTAVRREAIRARHVAYDAAAPEEAGYLAELIELENRDAVAQGYANAADRKYQELGLDDSVVVRTLAAVEGEATAYRAYQKVVADHAAAKLKVPSVLSEEMDLGSTKGTPISLDEARGMILEALQPLGADYVERFSALVDPANGRLDLAGGAHRARTGTSISAYDGPTALYYSGYDGSLRDVSKIAHEGGHAIHREMMNASGIPVYERSGPNYLFEGFAIFNELLLLDHAAETATPPEAKQVALERLLSKIALELFVSAEETGFERALYTEAAGKGMVDRAKIDAVFRESLKPYEYFSLDDVGQSRGWMRKSLLFEDPLYLVNYLYASVIAVALYDKQQSDPEFAGKYQALLREGFDAEPRALLAKMGIRLEDPKLVEPAARLLERKTAELAKLYAESPE